MFPVIIQQNKQFIYVEKAEDLPIEKAFLIVQIQATPKMYEYGEKVKEILITEWEKLERLD